MSEAEQSAAWNNHVCQAAKSFLKCAVAIDDRPFSGGGSVVALNVRQSSEAEPRGGQSKPPIAGPIPSSPKKASVAATGITATSPKATNPQLDDLKTGTGESLDFNKTMPSVDSHDLDLRALTDSFAEQGIICGTLIPDTLRVANDTAERGEPSLLRRAQKMARTADILIIDWFLKKRNSETTLKIIETVLQADKDEGGRTRLICIYTGEDQLREIRDQVRDRLGCGHDLAPNETDDAISLTSRATLIVFVNKKKVGGQYAVAEQGLPVRLIREFASLIDGLLPSFAASSIGAIRRNTHGILNIFCAELDPAYIGNRAISDPSDEVAELIRELLVSEFDNQIGFVNSTENYLSKKAISLWLQTPGRIQSECKVSLEKQEKGQNVEKVEKPIDAKLIERAACDEIASLNKPFEIDGDKYRINEKTTTEIHPGTLRVGRCNKQGRKTICPACVEQTRSLWPRGNRTELAPQFDFGNLACNHEGRQPRILYVHHACLRYDTPVQ